MRTIRQMWVAGWCVLVAGLASAQLPILVQQDFEGYDLVSNPGTTVTTMGDGWTRYRSAITTNNVPDGLHGSRLGQINYLASGELRYWSSPAITGHVGTLTFDTSIYRVVLETNPVVQVAVFLADTNNKPIGYTPYTNITLTATNEWATHTVVFDQYNVTNKYLVIGRDQPDNRTFRLQIDSIVLRAAPSALTPTSLGLEGGGTSRLSNETLSPVLTTESLGTVSNESATLWYRYTGTAFWNQVAMVESGSTFVLASPLAASGQSNRQLEMYAVLDYSDEVGPQSITYPSDGAAGPVFIDILPVSGNSPMTIAGALPSELALTTNLLWRGGMEREAAVGGATYWFAGPSNTWGAASAPQIPFRASPAAGGTLPAPSIPLGRDVVFGFKETVPTDLSVEYGLFQSFENWGVTSAHGWILNGGAAVTNSAPSVVPGSSALRLAGGSGSYLQSPAQTGVRAVELWFRRLSDDTNTVTVTVEKQIAGVWSTAQTFAGRPTDLFDYRAVTLNDPAVTAVRIYADAPALVDNVAVTDLSGVALQNPVVTPDPVMATLQAGLTVEAVVTNGASVLEPDGIQLHIRYGTSGAFESPISLSVSNVTGNVTLYGTRSNAPIHAAPDALQVLQYYVTAEYRTWDGVTMPAVSTTTNTVEVVPYSDWGVAGLSVAGDIAAPMNLVDNQLWHGAFLPAGPIDEPTFWFQDATSGWWGATSPKMPPAFGVATNGQSFAFTNALSGGLAFSFDEATREYFIQTAEYESFDGGVLHGWTVTNLQLSATPALEGDAALATAVDAVVVSPVRASGGYGDVSFWACMTNPAATSAYTVEKLGASGWTTVGSGTVAGPFYRQYWIGASDPLATQVRVVFATPGVLVDEVVATSAGAYVAMSDPTFRTNTVTMVADTNIVPVVGYGGRPVIGITASPQNGAAGIAVRVAYTSDANPVQTNYVSLIGNPAGGVFTNTMPALSVGTNRYWYVVDYTGMNAAQIRYPETGYFRYATDGTLGLDRNPDPVAWAAALGFPASKIGGWIFADGWRVFNVFLQGGVVQFSGDASEPKAIVSPAQNGIGTIYFKAKPTLAVQEVHLLAVERGTSTSGPWTLLEQVEVPVSTDYTPFRIVVNNYGNLYVRIRRVTPTSDPENRLAIKDIVITPPPADVTVAEPSIITPGYPSEITPITFQSQVAIKAGSGSYPATDFQPTLVWRTGTNAWVQTAMTNTAVAGRYAMTLPPQPPAQIQYYYRVDFSGPSYTYADGTNVYDEGRSPAYLGWNGTAFTNSVQTSREVPVARPFRVRMFESNHSDFELRRDDSPVVAPMVLVDDHTWQAVLYLTNAVNMGIRLAGANPYTPGAAAYGPENEWGDDDQQTINPPLSGFAELASQTNIVVNMNYIGFVMLRFNVTNGLYQVRRAAFQDFNAWQASDVYFEESFGLYNITEYATDFEGVPLSVPTGLAEGYFDLEAATPFTPPYEPPIYVSDWRLENAWVTQERVATTRIGMLPNTANRAIRLNGGAGTLQTTPQLHTRGRDALSFKHRVSFGDENVPYYRNGFAWTDYRFQARATVSSASPGNPTLSLISYYYDRDNFYELRLTQDRVFPASNLNDRVVAQVYRKQDGVYTPIGTAITTNNVVLTTALGWDLGMTVETTGPGSVLISAYAGVVGGRTNTVLDAHPDNAAGVLAAGGTVSFNVHDAVTVFSDMGLTKPDGSAYPSSLSPTAASWYLGGTPLGGTGTRWTFNSGAITRPLPSVPCVVSMIRVGESTALPSQPVWVPVATNLSASLSYATHSVPLKTWDNTFLQVAPALSDGMLMVDDLSVRDWRGLTVTDPDLGGGGFPPGDPLGYTYWRATEAYCTAYSGSRKIELTRSRANPDLDQMLVSPVMPNGIGSIVAVYEASGGTCKFVVERNAFDGEVDDDDTWTPVADPVEVLAGGGGTVDLQVRTNMIGRVRIRMLPESTPGSSLWLDDLVVTDYPLRDNTSWEAYNALISKLQQDKTFEPDYPTHRTAYLNNAPDLTVPPNRVLNEDLPYIQSPEISTGIGEIGFWFRAWDPTAEFPGKLRLMMAPSATSTNWVEVTLEDQLADAAYKARLSSITNSVYEYFSIEIFDKDNKVLRLYAETNNASRVALDQVIVTEPVRSSIDILSVAMYPDIPLANDPVGVNVLLGNPRMDPYNIRVFLDYHLGSNEWGVANWGSNPASYTRVELEKSGTNEFFFSTTPATEIPAQPVDAVVQYRVVVTYEGIFASPIEYADFTNPAWYFPVDLNEQYETAGFSPYYFVFSCPTGAVFFNEFFYATRSAYLNREFVEIIGPRNASIANWRVDVIEASNSEFVDFVWSSYDLPADAMLGGGTNGWGFYVLGDTDTSISNKVDYYFPDGGDPSVTPAEEASLPSSGGFRLVRGMGAYVDRISYGASGIAGNEMVSRGYTFTTDRPEFLPSLSAQSIALVPLPSGSLGWATQSEIAWSPAAMNPAEAEFLGEIEPFPEPEQDAVAALTLAIAQIQCVGGIAIVDVVAASTNEVSDFAGWTGVLQTNTIVASDLGWGSTTSTVSFGTSTDYSFGTAVDGHETLFFRVKATNPSAP